MAALRIVSACGAAVLAAAGFMISRAQDPAPDTPVVAADAATDGSADQLPVSDPTCTYFGPNREKYVGNQPLMANAALPQVIKGKDLQLVL